MFLLILFGIKKQRKESISVPIYKKGDKTVVITEGCYCCQLHTKYFPKFSLKVNPTCRKKYWRSCMWILT